MNVKIISISNNSAVIVVLDTSDAYVVDLSTLPTKRVGTVVSISKNVLKEATPYGIDLSVAYPDGLCLNVLEIQEGLFSQGIFSLNDLKKNPSAISQILVHMANALGAEVYRKIKIVMEDYK